MSFGSIDPSVYFKPSLPGLYCTRGQAASYSLEVGRGNALSLLAPPNVRGIQVLESNDGIVTWEPVLGLPTASNNGVLTGASSASQELIWGKVNCDSMLSPAPDAPHPTYLFRQNDSFQWVSGCLTTSAVEGGEAWNWLEVDGGAPSGSVEWTLPDLSKFKTCNGAPFTSESQALVSVNVGQSMTITPGPVVLGGYLTAPNIYGILPLVASGEIPDAGPGSFVGPNITLASVSLPGGSVANAPVLVDSVLGAYSVGSEAIKMEDVIAAPSLASMRLTAQAGESVYEVFTSGGPSVYGPAYQWLPTVGTAGTTPFTFPGAFGYTAGNSMGRIYFGPPFTFGGSTFYSVKLEFDIAFTLANPGTGSDVIGLNLPSGLTFASSLLNNYTTPNPFVRYPMGNASYVQGISGSGSKRYMWQFGQFGSGWQIGLQQVSTGGTGYDNVPASSLLAGAHRWSGTLYGVTTSSTI